MSLRTDISVQLVWAIANTEANLAGETRIRPVHFFLGILKVVDPHFLKQLDGVEIANEEQRQLRQLSRQVRQYLEMSTEEVTQLRRSLRSGLREGKPEQVEIRMLHRADDSRSVFRAAAAKVIEAGGTALSALHLAESLFETGCVSLESIKRPRGRPSSKGAKWEVIDDGKPQDRQRFAEWFGRNLSRMAAEGKLPPFEGREGELRNMLRVLSRTSKRHIAIIGKPGVGKTALVEGLAGTLAQKKGPDDLSDYEVLELHGSDIASDCDNEAEVTRRLSHLFRVLGRHKTAVLLIDDFHGLFPAHLKAEAALALLTTILAENVTPCIITTVAGQWAELEGKAPSLARRFHVVQLADPPQADCQHMADAWAKRIADAQRITFAPKTIAAVLKAVGEMPAERAMPDRIVDLIENVATFIKVSALSSKTARNEVTPADVTAVLSEQYGIRSEGTPRSVG